MGKVANNQPINVGIHSDSTVAVDSTDSNDVTDSVPYGPKTAEEVNIISLSTGMSVILALIITEKLGKVDFSIVLKKNDSFFPEK